VELKRDELAATPSAEPSEPAPAAAETPEAPAK